MTHEALTNPTLFYFLVGMTLLLVMFLGAVIAAPPSSPGSPAPQVLEVHALPDQAPAPLAPLPRRPPLATAPAAGAGGWSADADNAASDAGGPMPAYDRARRPKVTGRPPWGPAPKPPGPDPWAAGNPSPGWRPRPDEGSVSPAGGRPPSSKAPPPTPAPAGKQTRHPRHGRGR